MGNTMFLKALTCAMAASVFFGTKAASLAAQPNSKKTQAPEAASVDEFVSYTNTECGIAFKYPRDWQRSKADGKEGVIKIAGTMFGDSGEMVLNRFTDGASPEAASTLIRDHIFPKLVDFKSVQEKKITIGVSQKIPAILQDITFSVNGLKVSQRYVIFQVNGNTLVFVFTAASGAPFNTLVYVFNHTLQSVRTGASRTVGTAKNTSTVASTTASTVDSTTSGKAASVPIEKPLALRTYQAKSLPVTFCYPADWQVTPGTHSDEAVNMAGTNAKGQAAWIVLNRGDLHASVSVDDLADSLENEYFAPKKDFHRVQRQSQNLGRMSKISGVVQQQTYVQSGAPVKQMVAMFRQGDHAYALSLVSPSWSDSDMHQLFSKVLASLELQEN
jgi:hypothetical protein